MLDKNFKIQYVKVLVRVTSVLFERNKPLDVFD